MTAHRRLLAALGTVAAALVASCGRGPKPGARPAPTPRDTTRARAPATNPTPSDTAKAAPVTRPDSTRVDSARADSARRTPPRRRNTSDPTLRCGTVSFNQGADAPIGSHANYFAPGTAQAITYIGGGVVARCSAIKNRLQSDSAEYYEATGTLFLINNVIYDEPTRVHLTSQRLTYYTKEERLLAEGAVTVIMPTGTTMNGPNAEYLREAPAIRDRAQLTATGRPTLRVVSAPRPDSARRTPTTTRDTATIIANTIVDRADSAVYASGQVQILRTDVAASSDSATFDQNTELAHLVNHATIEGRKGRSFNLSGTLIDLFSRERELTRVVSRGAAHVVSEDLDLKSDTVDLRVRDSRVEHAFAWGKGGAVATSPDRDVVADSIEAILPNQRIRELRAVRRAVARSMPDTTKIASKERDMLAGDTIVARFDSTAAATADTTKNPNVRQIVASGHAWSLYQLATSEGRNGDPGVNYVRGRLITVAFDSGQMQTVTVIDSASGVYLEPGADTTADTTAARRGRATPPRSTPRSVPPVRRPREQRFDVALPRRGGA